jgi:hypothetical protein
MRASRSTSATSCASSEGPDSIAVFRDDSGNWFSLTERRSDPTGFG